MMFENFSYPEHLPSFLTFLQLHNALNFSSLGVQNSTFGLFSYFFCNPNYPIRFCASTFQHQRECCILSLSARHSLLRQVFIHQVAPPSLTTCIVKDRLKNQSPMRSSEWFLPIGRYSSLFLSTQDSAPFIYAQFRYDLFQMFQARNSFLVTSFQKKITVILKMLQKYHNF